MCFYKTSGIRRKTKSALVEELGALIKWSYSISPTSRDAKLSYKLVFNEIRTEGYPAAKASLTVAKRIN